MLNLLSTYPEDHFYKEAIKIENYVGKLQEVIQNAGFTATVASYKDSKDEILSNGNHRFTVTCSLLGAIAEGVGASKKEAKQNAAKSMLKQWKP